MLINAGWATINPLYVQAVTYAESEEGKFLQFTMRDGVQTNVEMKDKKSALETVTKINARLEVLFDVIGMVPSAINLIATGKGGTVANNLQKVAKKKTPRKKNVKGKN